MKIRINYYLDILSEIENDITLAISVGFENNNKRSLVHIMAGKHWDIARLLENLK